MKTAANMFQSIPLDFREQFYTDVIANVLYFPSDEKPATPSEPKKYIRMVSVCLLNKFDPLEIIEEKLSALDDINITRAITSVKCNINLRQSLSQIYEHSKQYESFRDKLWGPQEEEIGIRSQQEYKF